ncbi:glycerol acyltransferase [Fulvivirga sp. M361]|uniref:1-acyl-sn-glycerol-3-phosphate acyltransferase n=1 Tax=Fulvivirga sp. M361 TaxID=2594266 RepID=UPI00117A08BE|nr:1-acyl-sn-glycerol-3-phosphate acyltransferase [Fulvivirga sp. M361]TRX50655.1 glycerol acyltransferase [Fulvivirga sp. M361]
MDKFVDVKRLIVSKNKKLLKWLPGFVVRWIERVIHQDEVNAFMAKYKDEDAYGFSQGAIETFNLQLDTKGLENVPKPPQSCIFVSNHPLGGLDAIAIIHSFKTTRPDIKFIVNDLLMNVRSLKEKFIGVNKVGRNAAASLQKVEEQFASGTATFIFPAGLVSRKTKGKIEDLEWKKTFISKAKKYNKSVVPVHIDGRLTNRFYRLANVRKFLGVKLNIEMFFLVDELFKQANTKIDIVIGNPIKPEHFTSDKSDKEWAQWVKKQVYQLKEAE